MNGHGPLHMGRRWSGREIEDDCPCPQEPCGLVSADRADPACEHHPVERARSLRQIHAASACPAVDRADAEVETLASGRTPRNADRLARLLADWAREIREGTT